MYFLLVVLISAITAYADTLMKVAGLNNGFALRPFLFALFLYVATGPCWYFLMKVVKLSSIGVLYGVTTAVLLALYGVFISGEKLGPIEIVAVAMGIITIVILAPRFS